jgi:hypothetical protein
MKKRLITLTSLLSAFFVLATNVVQAQITNPAISERLGGDAQAAAEGTVFVTYFIILWRGVIAVGGLFVLIYFMWGSIEWITAAGEAGKITKARDKIIQAVIGMIMLISSFAIIGFVSTLFFGDDFNLLNLTIPQAGRAQPVPPSGSQYTLD